MRRVLVLAAASLFCFALLVAGPVRADDKAELKAVIDKAVKAHGGEANLLKYKASSWKGKGKVHVMGGIDWTGEWYEVNDAKLRFSLDMEVMGMALKTVQVINDDKGWLKVTVGGNDVLDMEMTKEMIDEAKEEFYAGRIMSMRAFAAKDKGLELSPLGEVKVNGKPCIGIRVASKDRRDVMLFLDKETHLVAKAEHRIKDFEAGGEEKNQEYFFNDYKELDGVKEATRFAMHRDGKPFLEAEVSEFKHLDKLDDALFQKP
jgi:hypothetical protein